MQRSTFQARRTALTRGEWRSLAGMGAVVVGLHVVGFVLLIAVVAPHHYALGGSGAFTVGLGLTAYTLGLRHAFDADHISAIDNTTRKLMAERQRPLSVGFWFSLGHSSIVFALAVLFAVGIRALAAPVRNRGSALHHVTSLIGTGVSGGFLYLIAALNLVVLVGILRVCREMRRGSFDEAELERQLNSRGLMNRVYGRFARMVRRPWHMYPLGLLFGLGFDTATEVGVLGISATQAAQLAVGPDDIITIVNRSLFRFANPNAAGNSHLPGWLICSLTTAPWKPLKSCASRCRNRSIKTQYSLQNSYHFCS